MWLIKWYHKQQSYRNLKQLLKKKSASEPEVIYRILKNLYEIEYNCIIEDKSANNIPFCTSHHFQIEGHNPGVMDKNYFGQLELSPCDENRISDAQWKIGITNQVMHGKALRSKGYIFIRFYYFSQNEKQKGFVVYKKLSHEKFIGFWMEENYKSIGKEILTII